MKTTILFMLLALPRLVEAEQLYICRASSLRVVIAGTSECRNERETERAARVSIRAIVRDEGRRFRESREEQRRVERELLRSLRCEWKEVH